MSLPQEDFYLQYSCMRSDVFTIGGLLSHGHQLANSSTKSENLGEIWQNIWQVAIGAQRGIKMVTFEGENGAKEMA